MPDNLTTTTTVSTIPSGTVIATDEVGSAHVQIVKLMDGTDGGAGRIGGDATNGLDVDVTRVSGTVRTQDRTDSAQLTYVTTATVAAGASTNLDSAQVTSATTARLLGLLVSASVPFKAELRTVANGVASANKAVWFSMSGGWDWKTPGRDFIQVAHSATAGLDGFRVVVTNNDLSEAADVYCSFFFDET